MRQGRIQPPAKPWKGFMLPLDHWRLMSQIQLSYQTYLIYLCVWVSVIVIWNDFRTISPNSRILDYDYDYDYDYDCECESDRVWSQTPEFGLIKVLALSGFDPPTPGLWAPCASSAPKRLLTLDAISRKHYCIYITTYILLYILHTIWTEGFWYKSRIRIRIEQPMKSNESRDTILS